MYLANLSAERTRAGYSQSELARLSGAGRPAISNYEGLRRQANPETVRRLAAVLEVSVEDLYGEQPEPAPVFAELRDRLREADARGGREEQISELERYLQRDPDRLRKWLYEVSIEELTARSSLSERDYGGAAAGAGRASAKALEIYPFLLLFLLDLVQDLLSRDSARPALPPAETTPEPAPATETVRRSAAPGPRRENAAKPEED